VPGPLVARWLTWMLEEPRAGAVGAARVELENAGTATWREDVACSYHWLDALGNPIVWDGIRTPLPRPVAPGERFTLRVDVRAPAPPGRYRLALDLVAEHRAWFGEVGEGGPEEELDVLPRVVADRLEEVATVHVPAGWELAPGSAERALAAHAEGYAVVAPSIEAPRRLRRALEPWSDRAGPDPGFAHPLLCPSVLRGIELERLPDVDGLPAYAAPRHEPWIYDGRVVVRPVGRR
jgi:hypothetical protein